MQLADSLTKPKEMKSPEQDVQMSINRSTVAHTTVAEKIGPDTYKYIATFNAGHPRPQYLTSVQLLFMGGIMYERTHHKQTNKPLNEDIGDPDKFTIELRWEINWKP
jgi:hypothetical protein